MRPALPSEVRRTAGSLESSWPSRLARWAAFAGAVFIGLVLLGFLATRVYDRSFAVGRFTDDSFSTWITVGLRAIVPPVGWVVIVVVVWLVLRTIWQATRSAFAPVHRLASRVESTMTSAMIRRTTGDRLSIARWLLIAQVIVTVTLFLRYYDLLIALIMPFDRADPSVWQVLFYSEDHVGVVNEFQAFVPISAAVMGVGWWRLIRSAGGVVALDRAVVAAGFIIILLLVAAPPVSWRVFNNARHLQRYQNRPAALLRGRTQGL